ncbi:helix-turn-helix domain-containing protein [Luteibacter aegosomatissinici]|uniref:helix-turn-helix domain-containing protein n=1 Tax=Luteibacter aegosomatissinici TaxID=2911539 RepID=UPI001FFA3623|nr:helix-turn-helix domain-containing protein [Luteibacter aegosomatissinici]UPG94009.1 helix-turn-helix domain-containing protein [Luteibacter aegosomatissinici]
MSELFAFDSEGLAPDDAFQQYGELYASGSDVERLASPFFARVRSWRLDRYLLFSRSYGGVRHYRSTRIDRDGFDHFVLHHVVSGQLSGGQFGKPAPVHPGETLLLDTREPMESSSAGVELVTVSLARDAMRAAAGDVGSLHGCRIGAREGALLGALLRELVRQAPCLAPAAHAAVTRSLVDLLSIAIHPVGAAARSDFYRQEHVRRETVRRLVDANLTHPDFSVQRILAATGMSRAALYRLFEPQGGVARYIQMCRVEQLRRHLDDRTHDRRALSELAPELGFSSESHAGRLFKQAFGISPGAYRAASMGGAQSSPVAMMVRRWDSALRELA